MLILKRLDGEWIRIEHKSGDVIMIRTYNVFPSGGHRGSVQVGLHDPDRNFEISRVHEFEPFAKKEEIKVAP
jgi:hypothetical protein